MTTFILTLLVFASIATLVVYLKMKNSLPETGMDVARAEIQRKAALYDQWVKQQGDLHSTQL